MNKLPWWARLVVGAVAIATSIIGTIWGFFELQNQHRKEDKMEVRIELIREMDSRKASTEKEMIDLKDKIDIKTAGLQQQLSSMDAKLNILIQRSARIVERGEGLYTTTKNKKTGDEI